jgi:hypothetical protein
MPRRQLVFVDGAVYHVYRRVTRGERVFADETAAAAFVEVGRNVKRRDGLTVFAWCLTSKELACSPGSLQQSVEFLDAERDVSQDLAQEAAADVLPSVDRHRRSPAIGVNEAAMAGCAERSFAKPEAIQHSDQLARFEDGKSPGHGRCP